MSKTATGPPFASILQKCKAQKAFPSGEGGPLAVDEEKKDEKKKCLVLGFYSSVGSAATFPAREG